MTTYPAPHQPYYATPPLNPRPTSVTILAIIGIIFGGLGVLCKPCLVLPLFMPNVGPPNPMLDAQFGDPLMVAWTIGGTVIGWILSGLLLAASIGSLMLKPWARKGMMVYAVLAIVMNVVEMVVSIVWVGPMMREIQEQQPTPGLSLAVMQSIGIAITVTMFVVKMVYPLLLLYFYRRPDVLAAFGGEGHPGGDYGGGNPYAGPPGYYAGGAPPAAGGYYGQPSQQSTPAYPPANYPPPGDAPPRQ